MISPDVDLNDRVNCSCKVKTQMGREVYGYLEPADLELWIAGRDDGRLDYGRDGFD